MQEMRVGKRTWGSRPLSPRWKLPYATVVKLLTDMTGAAGTAVLPCRHLDEPFPLDPANGAEPLSLIKLLFNLF